MVHVVCMLQLYLRVIIQVSTSKAFQKLPALFVITRTITCWTSCSAAIVDDVQYDLLLSWEVDANSAKLFASNPNANQT